MAQQREYCQECGRRIPSRAFTSREKEIVQLILMGKTNPEIGAALGLTVSTIKITVSHIMRKTKTSRRVELAMKLSQPIFRAGLGLNDSTPTVGA